MCLSLALLWVYVYSCNIFALLSSHFRAKELVRDILWPYLSFLFVSSHHSYSTVKSRVRSYSKKNFFRQNSKFHSDKTREQKKKFKNENISGVTVDRKILRLPSPDLFFLSFLLYGKQRLDLLLVTSSSTLCRCIYAISFTFVFLSMFIFLKNEKRHMNF